ncbi:MAG: hypothetical protein R2681_02995 [Pyrinomonadaceae bacterium]
MIKQNDQNIIDDTDIRKEAGKQNTAFTSEIPSIHNSISNDNNKYDDLIASLSAAYENKRARQVFNWEKMRISTIENSI